MQLTTLQSIVIWVGLINSYTKLGFTVFLKDWQQALVTGFDVNYVIWLAMYIATRMLLSAPTRAANRYDYLLAFVFLGLYCIPSSLICGLLVFIYTAMAAWLARHERVGFAGLTILFLVSLKLPLLAMIYKTTGYYIYAVDAFLSGSLLSLFIGPIDVMGNVIRTGTEHTLLVVQACTSINNIYLTMIAWITVMRTLFPVWHKKDFLMLFLLGTCVFFSNTVRIALMGLSYEDYNFYHEGFGKDMYDVVLITITLAFILLARKFYVRTTHLAH